MKSVNLLSSPGLPGIAAAAAVRPVMSDSHGQDATVDVALCTMDSHFTSPRQDK